MLFAGRDSGFIAFSLTSVGTPARTAAKNNPQIRKSIDEDSSNVIYRMGLNLSQGFNLSSLNFMTSILWCSRQKQITSEITSEFHCWEKTNLPQE